MKKLVLALLVLALAFTCGCAKEDPAPTETVPATTVPETTVPETTEATVPAPELVYGTAEVNGVAAVLDTLSRGDMVDVVDSFDEKHYVLKTESGYGLVEKNLVRVAGEPQPELWTGYALYNAELHSDFRMTGEPLKKLKSNAKVEVLDDLGWCYFVQYEEVSGYMALEDVSKYPRKSGSGNGGGGGGGGGADGGDIQLQFNGGVTLLSLFTPQEGNVSGQATVLADGVEVILGYFDRGEQIPIVAEAGFAEEKKGCHTVYLNGLYTYVSETLVRMEGEEPYAEWEGYSKYKAVMYEDLWLHNVLLERMNTNTKVRVLFELENCYLVETDGLTGYMPKDKVSQFKNSSGGGGGGGGGEWSPPAL